jgi:hypothetical protein
MGEDALGENGALRSDSVQAWIAGPRTRARGGT